MPIYITKEKNPGGKMAININSEAYCRKAYLNYHCYGNTMGISAEDMGRITQAWGDRVNSWQATVASDENEYEFDDSDYARYRNEGEKAAKKATGGYDGKKGGTIARGSVDAGLSVIGAAGSIITKKVVTKAATKVATKVLTENITKETAKGVGQKIAVKATTKASEKLAEEAAKKGGEKVAEESATAVATEAGKNVGKSAGCIVGCVVGAATAAAYWAKRPNKEEKEACDALQSEMAGAQGALAEAQGEMECMSDEIIALSDEANMVNEDTNEEIEEQKTEYDMYLQTLLAIQEKAEAGEPLTDSEKELYKEVVGYLSEIGINIEEMSEDTTDEVADLYDEISTYQDGYDYTAETMGEIEGLTDYAEGFDSATRTMCYVEAGAQTLNAGFSAKSAYEAFALAASGSWAFGATAWAYAFGVMGAAAAVSSGIAAGQQMTWAGEVGTEIEMRKATQDLNLDTMDIYTEEVDSYDGFMQGVEDLEIEMPDDLEVPEGEGFPAEGEDPNGIESTEFTDYTDVLNEVEEGSKVVTENEDGTGKAIIAAQYGTAIAAALGLPDSTSGGKFGQDAIPAIIAQLMPGISADNILLVMNGGTLDSSFDASLIQTVSGKDTGKDTNVDNSQTATEKLRTVINFYKPIFTRASLQGWKC